MKNLLTLFDAAASSKNKTRKFRNISHEELVISIVYWIDQCKSFFGEPVIVSDFHSFNEEGIDIAVDLLDSPRIRFGIQIKSYHDIQEKWFARKVHAQISRSHKHDISKLMIGFAGDMNDSSQCTKVSGIISDLHQNKGDKDYVTTLKPEIVWTIYNAYKRRKNPLKLIKLDLERAAELSSSLSAGLSNDLREVTVNIGVKYDQVEDNPIRIRLEYKLEKGELSLLDQIERIPSDGQSIKIPKDKINEFQVYERGKPLFARHIQSDIEIFRQDIFFPLILQSVSNEGTVVESLDSLNFRLNKEIDGQLFYEFADNDHPLSLRLPLVPNRKVSLSVGFDSSRGDVSLVKNVVEFLQSLSNTKRLRVIDLKSKKEALADVDPKGSFDFDEAFMKVLNALEKIQQKTGFRLKYPQNPEQFKGDDYRHVLIVADRLEKGRVPVSKVNATIELPRIQALFLLDEYERNRELKDLSKREEMVTEKILGQDIKLGPADIIAKKTKPVENIEELRKRYLRMNSERVELDIESIEGTTEMKLLWFAPSN